DFHVTGVQTCALPICGTIGQSYCSSKLYAVQRAAMVVLSILWCWHRSHESHLLYSDTAHPPGLGGNRRVYWTAFSSLFIFEKMRSEERRVGIQCISLW